MTQDVPRKLVIPVYGLPEQGRVFAGEIDGEVVQLESTDELKVCGPLTYDLHVQVAHSEAIVRGRVTIELGMLCSRCLSFFSTTIGDYSFLRAYALAEGQHELDLTSAIREAVLLAVPQKPLCDVECRGLCPLCGTNLNEKDCGCRRPPADAAWSELDKLDL